MCSAQGLGSFVLLMFGRLQMRDGRLELLVQRPLRVLPFPHGLQLRGRIDCALIGVTKEAPGVEPELMQLLLGDGARVPGRDPIRGALRLVTRLGFHGERRGGLRR